MSPRHQISSTPAASIAARTVSRAGRLEWTSLRTARRKRAAYPGQPRSIRWGDERGASKRPYLSFRAASEARGVVMAATDSIAELRDAVEAAARALRNGEPTEPA